MNHFTRRVRIEVESESVSTNKSLQLTWQKLRYCLRTSNVTINGLEITFHSYQIDIISTANITRGVSFIPSSNMFVFGTCQLTLYSTCVSPSNNKQYLPHKCTDSFLLWRKGIFWTSRFSWSSGPVGHHSNNIVNLTEQNYTAIWREHPMTKCQNGNMVAHALY